MLCYDRKQIWEPGPENENYQTVKSSVRVHEQFPRITYGLVLDKI